MFFQNWALFPGNRLYMHIYPYFFMTLSVSDIFLHLSHLYFCYILFQHYMMSFSSLSLPSILNLILVCHDLRFQELRVNFAFYLVFTLCFPFSYIDMFQDVSLVFSDCHFSFLVLCSQEICQIIN